MTRFLQLDRLLADGRPDDTPVAVRNGQALDWATFVGHVGALRDAVGAHPGPWALFTADAYAFAVGLMAIWQADSTAVVLPNGQPGTLAGLAPAIRGLVCDGVEAPGVRTEPALRPARLASWAPCPLERAAMRLQLSTSGTTGDRRHVGKTVAQLGDEVEGLERHWGREVEGRQVLGTVSPQHIYGLLFRVLWPLCAGRVFRAESLLYPEEMLAALAGSAGCLVTTPAHLRRLKDMRGVRALAEVCRPIFSSGAPLDAASASRLAETAGLTPFEVFGSTETGGVAWRQQDGGSASTAWQPFRGVRVSVPASGRLHVQSPYVGDDAGLMMADRAELRPDGRFVLAGRTDRVVKIGGTRLSLPEMEERLLRHPAVSEAALAVVDARGEPRVACVVVLVPNARAALAGDGRRALTAELVAHLAPYWERVLLPRLWRFVDRLPEDEQGKVAGAALTALFEPAADDAVTAPDVLAESTTGTTCIRRWRVPEALAWCEGHFPELSVVPGFVQLGWVMEVARSFAGSAASLHGVEALKFRELLRPGDVVELHAEWSPATSCLAYRMVRDDGRVVSSGRCRLAEAAS
jgi:acyl-CoA synthetase (AMP-forming)/AMP-acid ligase II/3-hydroxymyristoyl/3-hydroxydecanoyl-(acyl carrier protein) dehydratase